MKIVKYRPEGAFIQDTLYINHLAFCGIDHLINSAHVCFECIDSNSFLVKLSVPVLIEDGDLPEFLHQYEYGISPTGLMWTREGVANLCIVDIFRKVKEEKSIYYETICLDLMSDADKQVYYRVLFTREQLLIIMAFTQDVLSLVPIDYKSHLPLYLLTSEVKENHISDYSYNMEIVGVKYPDFGIFRNDCEMAVLLKLTPKPDTNKSETYYTIWHLSYNKDETKNIVKNKKYKNFDPTKIEGVIKIYDFVGYTIVNYAINANNPMTSMYIEAVDVNNNTDFSLFSFILTDYNSFIEKIYHDLTN